MAMEHLQLAFLLIGVFASDQFAAHAAEFHVALNGQDAHRGTR